MVKLSIIIPTLNEEETIHTLLQSLQHFRKKQHEIIVVDGGSTDTTIQKLYNYADQILICEASRAKQMNLGAAHANGNTLLFLHADTLLPENADELIANGLQSNCHRWGRFAVQFTGKHFLLNLIAFMMKWRSRISGIATGDQAIFIEKGLFDQLGGYAPIPLMEDIELCKRLLRYSQPACLNDTVLTSSRRWEVHGMIKTIITMWWLRFIYFAGVKPELLAKQYYPIIKKN